MPTKLMMLTNQLHILFPVLMLLADNPFSTNTTDKGAQLRKKPSIIAEMNINEIEMLDINTLDFAILIANAVPISHLKLQAIFYRYLKVTNKTYTAFADASKFKQMRNLTCGISSDHIRKTRALPLSAIETMGKLDCFGAKSLDEWGSKIIEIYGSNIRTWDSTFMSQLGNMICGIPSWVFYSLSDKQVSTLTLDVVGKMNFDVWSIMTTEQLELLSLEQASTISKGALDKISEEQKEVIQRKKSLYDKKTDSKIITSKDETMCGFVSPTTWVVQSSMQASSTPKNEDVGFFKNDIIEELLQFLERVFNGSAPASWKLKIFNTEMYVIKALLQNETAMKYHYNKRKDLLLSMAISSPYENQVLSQIIIDNVTAMSHAEVYSMQQVLKEKHLEFLKNISPDLLQMSGVNITNQLFAETKDELIKKMPQNTNAVDERPNIAAMNVYRLVLSGNSTNEETLSKILNSSLVSMMSANKMESLSMDLLCNDENRPHENLAQIQIKQVYEKCQAYIKDELRKYPEKLGQLITAITRQTLPYDAELLKRYAKVSCAHEPLLEIDMELAMLKQLKFLIEDISEVEKNFVSQIGCILKHAESLLKSFDISAGIFMNLCKIVSKTDLKRITNIEFWKRRCLSFVMQRMLPLYELHTLLQFLTSQDVGMLPIDMLHAATLELSILVADKKVNTVIAQRLRQNRRKEVEDINSDYLKNYDLYIATWPANEIEQIPKESFTNITTRWLKAIRMLKGRYKECMRRGTEEICAGNMNLLKKVVDILYDAVIALSNESDYYVQLKNADSCVSTVNCEHIHFLEDAAEYLDASKLSGLCREDFENCAGKLGSFSDFSREHKKVVVNLAKKYWKLPEQWSEDQLLQIAGSITGLTASEIETLKITSIDVAYQLGKLEDWTADQLKAAFKSWLTHHKRNTVSSITGFELQAIGNLVCGATESEIAAIPTESYIYASHFIGNLNTCQLNQQRLWIKKAKEKYGENIEKWNPVMFGELGSVINALPKSLMKKLTDKQISAIPYSTIPLIEVATFKKFQNDQLKYFTSTQKLWFSKTQMDGFSQEQKEILKLADSNPLKNNHPSDVIPKMDNGGNKVKMPLMELLLLLLLMVFGMTWVIY